MANTESAKAQLAKQQGGDAARNDNSVTGLIEQLKPQIERALPTAMTADRFARIVMTTLRNNPGLAKCDPRSLMSACMLSAQLGLEPGTPLGHAYFVPFKREITFVIGYRGLIDLARRSGEVESIEAREVRKNDLFEFEFGLEPKLKHVPASGERGEPVYYWGLAKFKDGGHFFEVLSKEDVDTYRQRSNAKDNGPWVTDYSAMAKKTVVRRMAPYLPLSAEAARAVASDEGVVASLDELSDDGEVGVTHDVEVVRTQRDEPDGDEAEDPDTLTKAQLTRRLHQAGLDPNGEVEELRERYKAHLAGEDDPTYDSPAGEGDAEQGGSGAPAGDPGTSDEAGPAAEPEAGEGETEDQAPEAEASEPQARPLPDEGDADTPGSSPSPPDSSPDAPPSSDEAEGEDFPASPSDDPPAEETWREHAIRVELTNQQGAAAVVPILKALRDQWEWWAARMEAGDSANLKPPSNSRQIDALAAKYPDVVHEAIDQAAREVGDA